MSAERQWLSAAAYPAPRRVQPANDTLNADTAYRLMCEGTALLWQGDFINARLLLQAVQRRVERKLPVAAAADSPEQAFHKHRQAQAQRARILALLLVPVETDGSIPLRRSPHWHEDIEAVYGRLEAPAMVSLRELQGVHGAGEWRRRGVAIAALGGHTIHPWHGVFSPVRGEYLELLEHAPLPSQAERALDVGTGTGVIAALLARRGIAKVVATDKQLQALACARDNLNRLGLASRVQVREADLFVDGVFDLLVCNPPWLPGKPATPLESAIYDPDSRMLRGFLAGAAKHLAPTGEAWLILSDLAERLELRSRQQLLDWINQAGLRVLDRLDVRPRQRANAKRTPGMAVDALEAARRAEITSLWRLAHSPV
jgi:tRNA1(Val) A37 N6-methylase TrmN6